MIIAAAIKQDGKLFALPAPARHHDVIHYMVNHLRLPPPITGEQGFIDHERGFLSRAEAAERALLIGQVQQIASEPRLFSEDLW